MDLIMPKFRSKFKINELLIYETKYWIWSLRPAQATLGAGILSLKRECHALKEVNKEEFADLKNAIKIIETTLYKTFNYDVMNYLMLMMVDKQVHYHVIARYEHNINFAEIMWKDTGWPGVPNLAVEEMDLKTLKDILVVIKENLTVDSLI